MAKIKVYVKVAGKNSGRIVMIENELSSLRKIVGGRIEHLILDESLERKGIVSYCNDEGKIIGLPANIWGYAKQDIIVGNIVFVKDDGDGGDCSLLDVDIVAIDKVLKKLAF